MDLKRQGGDALDIVRSEAGQTTMDEIRRVVAEGRAVEERRIADLSRRAARVALELQLAILVTVALIVALAAYLVLETRRNFQALAAALRAVVETNENLERTVEAKTSQIRESEEKLRNAVADAAIGFAMNTPDGVYIDANPAYCRLTGYSLEELRGMTFSEVVHPDDAVSNMENARRMLGGEIDNYVVENRYRRKDGAAVWVRKSLSTTRDEKGKYKWIVALVEDVSERKQAEAELLRLNATLEQRVHEAIEARQAAQSRLAQAEKLGALGQLAGGVAHDFNNIAQAVTGGASMIGRHADDPVRVRRYAGMLAEAATRAASITRRLLSLARRGHLQAEAVEVAPLLEGLREFLSHTLGANVAMQLKAPTSMPRVLVDKGQLKD
jgi:PAS domain S-box-containing protein